jgi:hypothetical protein
MIDLLFKLVSIEFEISTSGSSRNGVVVSSWASQGQSQVICRLTHYYFPQGIFTGRLNKGYNKLALNACFIGRIKTS